MAYAAVMWPPNQHERSSIAGFFDVDVPEATTEEGVANTLAEFLTAIAERFEFASMAPLDARLLVLLAER